MKLKVGLEVEVEFERYSDLFETPRQWRMTKDGSLRGTSAEFVLNGPRLMRATQKCVLELYDELNKDCVLRDTTRAGVHLHIDCRDLSITEFFNLLVVAIICEEAITKRLGGKGRWGNLFNTPMLSTPGMLLILSEKLQYIVANDGDLMRPFNLFQHNEDNWKYSGINLCSLWKQGSLEIRSCRTPMTPGPIIQWTNAWSKVVDIALSYDNPMSIMSSVSRDGYGSIVRDVTGEDSTNEIYGKRGVQCAQFVAFAADTEGWDTLKKYTINKDCR